MGVASRKEIRDSVLDTTRQENVQIGLLVNDFINLTLNEINDPGWAFPKNFNHLWSWLKSKTTFSTVASQEDYVLGREVDKIALLRQTTSPTRLLRMTDEQFYKRDANPTATGNPLLYRTWEVDGVSTRLTTADTIDVVSSSASDAGSSELAVTVSGYVSGYLDTQTYQLNGTTAVSGTKTFQAREIFVSKQKDTTGSITVKENSGGTTLVTLGPKERAPKFRVISLYPIPSSAITMYLQFYRRVRELNADSDVSEFDGKWNYVIRLGTLAKVYQYLTKEQSYIVTQQMYEKAVRAMVASDRTEPDLIDVLEPRDFNSYALRLRRADDVTF